MAQYTEPTIDLTLIPWPTAIARLNPVAGLTVVAANAFWELPTTQALLSADDPNQPHGSFIRAIEALIRGSRDGDTVLVIRSNAGAEPSDLEIECTVSPMRNGKGHVLLILRPGEVSCRACVSETLSVKATPEPLRAEARLLTFALQQACNGIWRWDIGRDRLRFDQALTTLLGLRAGFLDGPMDRLIELIHVDDRAAVATAFAHHVNNITSEIKIDCRLRDCDGRWRWLRLHGQEYPEERAALGRTVIGTCRDVHRERNSQAVLRRIATHDPLTGLLNRRGMLDRIETQIEKAARSGQRLALMMLDLDRFKDVNDTLGHAVGDRLLSDAAQRMQSAVRVTDSVGRLGGDEFAICLVLGPDNQALDEVAGRIIENLRKPYQFGDRQVHAAASLGIAIFPDDGTTATTLITMADKALYASKAAGRGVWHRVSNDLIAREDADTANLNALKRAVADRAMVMLYEPVTELEGGHFAAVRVQPMIRHPSRGLVPPAGYLAHISRANLESEWLDSIRSAISTLRRDLPRGTHVDVHVDVPVSALEPLIQAAPQWECLSHALVIDIDIEALRAPEEIAELERVKHAGYRIGFCCRSTDVADLSLLQRFRPDTLWLEPLVITTARNNREKAAMFKIFTSYADSLEITIAAAGVSSSVDIPSIEEFSCSRFSGKIVGRHMTDAALVEWARRRMGGREGRLELVNLQSCGRLAG